jgi:hypothetical protein
MFSSVSQGSRVTKQCIQLQKIILSFVNRDRLEIASVVLQMETVIEDLVFISMTTVADIDMSRKPPSNPNKSAISISLAASTFYHRACI